MSRIGLDARIYSSKFTGIGRYAYELIANLATLDTKNEYVVFLNPPEYADFVPPGKNFKPVKVNAPHYSLAEQTSLLISLLKAKLDLAHFTHFNAPLLYRRPFVTTIHDLTLSFFPGRKMTSPLHRFAYHQVIRHAILDSKKIIAVSEHTKKDILKLYPVPHEKITVTHEGIDSAFSAQRSGISNQGSAISQKTQIQNKDGNPIYHILNTKYLLYAGVWREHKNLKRLVEAYLLLTQKHRVTCHLSLVTCHCLPHLVITGKPDPLYAEILDLPKQANLHDRVHFVGHVTEEELLSLYRNALAFVFPSLYEGFGLPPLEAMACGTPVICSNASSLPEVCADAALYCDPLSVTDIAEKLERIITDEDLRTELSRKGLGNVRRFSWKTMAEQTLNVYHQALGR